MLGGYGGILGWRRGMENGIWDYILKMGGIIKSPYQQRIGVEQRTVYALARGFFNVIDRFEC